MKRLLVVAVFTLVASLDAPARSDAQSTDANAEREVLQTVRAVGDAWARHDVTALERLVSDDYTHFDVIGLWQNREEWLADVQSRARSDAVHQLAFEDLRERIYGDVAVVTGRNLWGLGRSGVVTMPLRLLRY